VKRFGAGDVVDTAKTQSVRRLDLLVVERRTQSLVYFLLRHQHLDVRPTNHRLRRLAHVVQFFESKAEGVSLLEET